MTRPRAGPKGFSQPRANTQPIGIHRPICPDGKAALDVPCPNPCRRAARAFVLAATILASSMAFIDASIVTIALPRLQADLGAEFASLQWIANAYALPLGGLILVGGSAGDRFGRRRVLISGVALFALASLLCAQAPSAAVLIAGRGVQGVGAALLVPQSLAIIASAFPKDVRGRAIGIWAGASAIATALGPTLGGFLIDTFDWRSAFWINLPLCAATLWLTLAYVPESRGTGGREAMDWLGAGIAVIGCASLAAGLTQLGARPGAPAIPAALMLTGFAALALFVRIEARARAPLMPLALFASRDFASANLITLLVYGALGGVLFLLPFDLMERRGLSAAEVGLTLLPFGLLIGSFSPMAGAWADRRGPRPALASGALLLALGAGGLALNLANFWLGVLVPILLVSFGMASVAAPLTTAVMNAAPQTQSGTASGINNAASRLAGLFAVASVGATASLVFSIALRPLGGTLANHRFGQLPAFGDPKREVLEQAFEKAYGAAMGATAACALVAALIALAAMSREPDA